MRAARLLLPVVAAGLIGTALTLPARHAWAAPKPENYWNVDHVRRGMKGHGRTVMTGTKVEEFQAEVLGILKNTSPGRDLVLCRLSGLDLLHNAAFLLNAGHETTSNLIGSGVNALFKFPDQLADLQRDPTLAGSAVEEMLR